MILRDLIEIETEKGVSFVDITDHITSIVEKGEIQEGLCHIFISHTTAGLMLNENDRMLFEDFTRLFEKLAPEEKLYSHVSNAFSHIRASMLKQEFTLPVSRNKLVLGTWQRIILWEFDKKPRKRQLIITVDGA